MKEYGPLLGGWRKIQDFQDIACKEQWQKNHQISRMCTHAIIMNLPEKTEEIPSQQIWPISIKIKQTGRHSSIMH